MKKSLMIPAMVITLITLFQSSNFLFAQWQDNNPLTWEKTYQGPASTTNIYDDYAYAICKADENNFYVAGGAGNPTTAFSPYIIKINPYGDTIWAREISLQGNISFKDIVQTEDNGCILVDDGTSARTIRLDSSGNIIWNKTYGITGPCYKIIKLSSGDYLIHGRRAFDSFVFKIDSNGELLWSRNFTSGFMYHIYSATESLSNNEYLFTGVFYEGFKMPANIFINKLNSNGDTLGYKFYQSIPVREIRKFNDGYVLGGTGGRLPGPSPTNFSFAVLDSNLNVQSESLIESDTNIYYGSFKVYNDNKIVVATNPYIEVLPISSRIYMVDLTGNILLHRELYSPEWTYIESIEIAENGHILFAGDATFSTIPFRRTDYYVVRTDSLFNYKTVGISSNHEIIPDQFKLYQNYPNPFNPTTNITIELTQESLNAGELYLEIFDVRGAIVNREKIIPEGSLRITKQINLTGNQSGIYFARVSGGSLKSNTIKLVLLK